MRLINLPKKTLFKMIVGLAAAAVVVLIIAAGGLFFPEEEKSLAPPLRKAEEAEYKTFQAKKSSIENTITCQGYFFPEKQVDVSFSNREGFLKAIYVRFGQVVSAGAMVASLDTDALLTEVKMQTLMLEEAREAHEKLKALSVPEIAAGRLELEQLKQDLEVKNEIKDSLPLRDIQKLENQVKLKEYALQKLTIDYDYRIAAAARDIEKAQVTLNQLGLELEKSELRAPVSGRVIYIAPVNQGERVPSYRTMASIADPQRLIVRYTGDQYPKFRLGMKVKILSEGKTGGGEVVMTPQQVPTEDFEKLKDTVYVRPSGLPAGAKIDDQATIEATLERADNVIVLPRRLVHTYGGRSFVKILENGIVNERDVKTGIESNMEYEITSGLAPDELVVE